MFLKIFFDDAMIDTSMIKDICMIFFLTLGAEQGGAEWGTFTALPRLHNKYIL